MVTIKHPDGIWTGLCQAASFNWAAGTVALTIDVTDPAGTVTTASLTLTGTLAQEWLVAVDTVDCRAQTFRDAAVLGAVFDGQLPTLSPPHTMDVA